MHWLNKTPGRASAASLLLFLSALLCMPMHAQAQGYPNKPVQMIVGFPPGGTTDIVARYLAQRMSDVLKQPVIVVNRPGAGGNLAADSVAKAPADGYSLLFGSTSSIAVAPALYSRLPYDPLRDLRAVGQVATMPAVLVVDPKLPIRSVQELVDHAKAHPNALNYGSAGNGSAPHMAGELLRTLTGVRITHVPYKGDSQALTDLVAGQIQMMFPSRPGVLQFIQGNRVRALAVTGRSRSASLPNLPTMAEAGFPDYMVESWFGFFFPAGTSDEVTGKLHAALATVLADRATQQRLEELGVDPAPSTPEAFSAYVRAEIAKWTKVAKFSNVKLD